jgi:hypothetical protein
MPSNDECIQLLMLVRDVERASPSKRDAFPHERSDLSHWRKRLGDKLELLLAESLRLRTRPARYAARTSSTSRSTPRCSRRPSTFPTDAYSRVAKAAAMMAGRYAHAKQFKRHQRQLRILRSRFGRIIREIRRRSEGQPVLEEAFALPLGQAAQIRSQQQRQRGWKLYSFHASALGLNPVWSLAIWSSVCPLDQDVGNRCADGGLVLDDAVGERHDYACACSFQRWFKLSVSLLADHRMETGYDFSSFHQERNALLNCRNSYGFWL